MITVDLRLRHLRGVIVGEQSRTGRYGLRRDLSLDRVDEFAQLEDVVRRENRREITKRGDGSSSVYVEGAAVEAWPAGGVRAAAVRASLPSSVSLRASLST